MAYNQQSPYQASNRPVNGRLQRPHGNTQQNGTYQGRGQDTHVYRSAGQPQAADACGYHDTRYAQEVEGAKRPQVQQDYFGSSGNRADPYTLPNSYARQPHGSPSLSGYRPPPIDKHGFSEASPQFGDGQLDRVTHFTQQDEPPRSAPAHQASFVIPLREHDNRNQYPETMDRRPAPPQRLHSSQSEHTTHHNGRVQPSGTPSGNPQAPFNFDIDNDARASYEEAPRSKSAGGNYSTKSSKSKAVKLLKPSKKLCLLILRIAKS